VYSVANAEEEIKLFANSPDARLEVIPGGYHFISASNPKEVDPAIIAFIKQHA
jgi:pimeloyl-ACP methyl ester carboxylesterase